LTSTDSFKLVVLESIQGTAIELTAFLQPRLEKHFTATELTLL